MNPGPGRNEQMLIAMFTTDGWTVNRQSGTVIATTSVPKPFPRWVYPTCMIVAAPVWMYVLATFMTGLLERTLDRPGHDFFLIDMVFAIPGITLILIPTFAIGAALLFLLRRWIGPSETLRRTFHVGEDDSVWIYDDARGFVNMDGFFDEASTSPD